MTYLLENQAAAHSGGILETLQNWSEEEADVQLISNQGAVIQTHRVFLRLYSPLLNNALQEFSADTIPSLFIPASTASLVNLIKILSTGVSISEQKEDLLDVVNAAELMGIYLKGIQIGAKGTQYKDPLYEENKVPRKDDNHVGGEVTKKRKRTKRKPVEKPKTEEIKTTDENSVVKKEYIEVDSDISFSVNEASFQQEFINQGQTVKDEPESDVSLSLQLDSSLETTDDEIGLETSAQNNGVDGSRSSREPVTCTDCGKTFVNKEKLKRHFLIHTGEKPYQCDECESKFTRKDKLDSHKNVKHNLMFHKEEKPYSCDQCESRFSRKDKLDNHINVKHNENYVKIGNECSVCSKAHGSKWHLNRHMERAHSF